MAHPIHVGCSGWAYRDWRERFYPPRLPQTRWLEHYARLRAWSRRVEVYAYFNNDWEAFAPRNALRLRTLLGGSGE